MHQAVEVFRALADPTRLAVFENVAAREMSVTELTRRINVSIHVSQPAISQHLAALRQSGLVLQRRDGRQIFYRADAAGMRPLVSWMSQYEAFWQEKLPRLRALLQESSTREDQKGEER